VSRAHVAWGLSAAVLVTGLFTAALAAENRARGAELDRRERWCETQARRNEMQAAENRRREWALLQGAGRDGVAP
jgi:hypothetical protein